MIRPATQRLLKLARNPQPQAPQPAPGAFPELLESQAPLLRPDQVSTITGWSRRMIYLLCETGFGVGEPPLLESHVMPGRCVQRKQITRRSVAALLLRTANYDPADFPKLLQLTLPTMADGQLQEFAAALEVERQRRTSPPPDKSQS